MDYYGAKYLGRYQEYQGVKESNLIRSNYLGGVTKA